jgi:hypothetical protein
MVPYSPVLVRRRGGAGLSMGGARRPLVPAAGRPVKRRESISHGWMHMLRPQPNEARAIAEENIAVSNGSHMLAVTIAVEVDRLVHHHPRLPSPPPPRRHHLHNITTTTTTAAATTTAAGAVPAPLPKALSSPAPPSAPSPPTPPPPTAKPAEPLPPMQANTKLAWLAGPFLELVSHHVVVDPETKEMQSVVLEVLNAGLWCLARC